MSNDEKFYAYIERSPESWNPEPVIYIFDLKAGALDNEIKIDIDGDFTPLSWSPKDQYIYVQEAAQYYGGLDGNIYDLKTGEKVYEFNTLNRWLNWMEDDFILYFDPLINCEDEYSCSNLDVGLIGYKISKEEKVTYEIISSANQRYPLIQDETILKDAFEFAYLDNYLDIDQDAEKGMELNLLTGKIQKKEAKNLLSAKIKQKLQKDYPDVEIDKIEKTKDGSGEINIKAHSKKGNLYYEFELENENSDNLVVKFEKIKIL